VQLEDILGGEGMRRWKVEQQTAVDHRTVGGAEVGDGGMARRRSLAAQVLREVQQPASGQANHADAATATGGGDGGYGIAGS
jgi:hypothetical protein